MLGVGEGDVEMFGVGVVEGDRIGGVGVENDLLGIFDCDIYFGVCML